jgi:hypothetical protein
MNQKVWAKAMMACGFAVVAAVGCSDRSGNRTAANGTAADENNARSSVTLTGCLQKGDLGSEYVLTEVNHSPTSVGTSGSTPPAGGDAVGQEQLREAARAYRLAGDSDALEPLVGKQVQVNGTVERRSKLNERTKIDADDLARVHVASIDRVADACSGVSKP